MTASSGITDKVITTAIGAAAALVPLIANSVVGTLQNRSARARRDNAITVAKNRVDFLSDWVKAQEQVSSPEHLAELKQSTSQELDYIRESVLMAVVETAPKPAEVADRRTLQHLFLLYWPRTVAGWVLHALFYMAVGVEVAWLWQYVYDDILTAQYSLIDDLPWILGVAIPLALFAVAMQLLARRVDNKENDRIKNQASA